MLALTAADASAPSAGRLCGFDIRLGGSSTTTLRGLAFVGGVGGSSLFLTERGAEEESRNIPNSSLAGCLVPGGGSLGVGWICCVRRRQSGREKK